MISICETFERKKISELEVHTSQIRLFTHPLDFSIPIIRNREFGIRLPEYFPLVRTARPNASSSLPPAVLSRKATVQKLVVDLSEYEHPTPRRAAGTRSPVHIKKRFRCRIPEGRAGKIKPENRIDDWHPFTSPVRVPHLRRVINSRVDMFIWRGVAASPRNGRK